MDIVQVADKYGWLLALAYFVMRDVWPRAWSVFSKTHQKKVDAQMTALELHQSEEIAAAQSERDARIDERKFRHDLDLRQAIAYEKLVEAYQTQSKALASIEVRMDLMIANLTELAKFMTASVIKMNETVAINHPIQKREEDKN